MLEPAACGESVSGSAGSWCPLDPDPRQGIERILWIIAVDNTPEISRDLPSKTAGGSHFPSWYGPSSPLHLQFRVNAAQQYRDEQPRTGRQGTGADGHRGKPRRPTAAGPHPAAR